MVPYRKVRLFDVDRFLRERKPLWYELDTLLRRAELEGVHVLGLDGARRMAKLYRVVSSDLLRARTELVDAAVVDSLNDLVGRGYSIVHGAEERRTSGAVTNFVLRGYPRLVRSERKLFMLAAFVLAVGAVVGAGAMARDPGATTVLIPEDHMMRSPTERVDDDAESGPASAQKSALFTTFLFTHNIRVSFLLFALGMTAGAGTLALLAYNGVPLGALAVHYHAHGKAAFFWAWILPHGIIELTAICLAATGGLVLARAIVSPGRRPRREAVAEAGKRATQLVLGTMPIFVLAGLVEGTVSQLHPPHVPFALKYATAALVSGAVWAYLIWAGREAHVTQSASGSSAAS